MFFFFCCVFCFVLVLKTLWWLLMKDWGKFTCTASAPCMPCHLVHILWATLIDLWATISVVCGFEHLAFLIKCSSVGSQGKKWDMFSITFLFIFFGPSALQLYSFVQSCRVPESVIMKIRHHGGIVLHSMALLSLTWKFSKQCLEVYKTRWDFINGNKLKVFIVRKNQTLELMLTETCYCITVLSVFCI